MHFTKITWPSCNATTIAGVIFVTILQAESSARNVRRVTMVTRCEAPACLVTVIPRVQFLLSVTTVVGARARGLRVATSVPCVM